MDFNLTPHNCDSYKLLPHSVRTSHVFKFLILHLAAVHNLPRGLLHLLQLRNEVPEAGLGDDMVRSEDPHAVQRRGRAFRRGQAAPDHLVLPQLERHEHRRPAVSECAAEPRPRPPRDKPAAPRRNNATRGAQTRGGQSPSQHRAGRSPRGAAADLGPHRAGAPPPPPCWPLAASRARRRRSGTHGPLWSATTRHHRPPYGRLGRTAGPGRARGAPGRTHGARRLHGAAPPRPQQRKGKGRPRAPPPHVRHPAPPRAAIGCGQRAIGARSCQSPPTAPASGLAAPRGPARPAPALPRALRGARPPLPAPSLRACMVPLEGDLAVRDSISRRPCWR